MQDPRWLRTVLLLAVAAVLLTACAGNAGAASKKESLIRIEVIRQEGSPIKGLVEDGSSLTLVDSSTGRTIAFKPDIHSKPAKVQVFEIEKGAQGAESMRLLDETEVTVGAPKAKPVAKIYGVRILEIIPRT